MYRPRFAQLLHWHAHTPRDRPLQVFSADPYLRGVMKTHPVGSVISGTRMDLRHAVARDAVGRVHRWNSAAGLLFENHVHLPVAPLALHIHRFSAPPMFITNVSRSLLQSGNDAWRDGDLFGCSAAFSTVQVGALDM